MKIIPLLVAFVSIAQALSFTTIHPTKGAPFRYPLFKEKDWQHEWTSSLDTHCTAVNFTNIYEFQYYIPTLTSQSHSSSTPITTPNPTHCKAYFDVRIDPPKGQTTLSFYNLDFSGQNCKNIIFSAVSINHFPADPYGGIRPTKTSTIAKTTTSGK